MKQSDELKAAIDELRKHGATGIERRAQNGAKHPRIEFVYQGKARFIIVSGSPSERNARHLIREHVRSVLGIVRSRKIVGNRRTRKNKRAPVLADPPTSLTPGRDCFVVLRSHVHFPAAQRIALDRAWASLFASRLRAAGHAPVNPMFRGEI